MFTFFWGQSYGGVEPYVVALWSFVAGSGAVSLNSVPMVLSAVAAVLAWRIGLRVVPPGMKVLALAAGAVLWVWPDVVIYNSTRELGFRGVTVVAGLALLLMAFWVIGRPSPFNIGVLGIVAGIGWWSSPEIIYFAVPAVAYLLFNHRELRSALHLKLLLLPAGFVVGAAPWLATNVRTGFLSLRASSSPSYVHSTYSGRLSIFFHKTLPMMLGFRMPLTGAWLDGRTGQVLFLSATVALLALCVVRGGRRHGRTHRPGQGPWNRRVGLPPHLRCLSRHQLLAGGPVRGLSGSADSSGYDRHGRGLGQAPLSG